MAEIQTRNPDHPKTVVNMAPGETLALCRCFASKQFPICDGLEGRVVTCPLHGATFNVQTGEMLTSPARADLRAYPVKIDGTDLKVALE